MRKLVVIVCICFSLFAQAQLYDAQWAIGDGESVLDFRNNDLVVIDSIPTLQYFTLANASICDESGSLLYYTNGVNICGVNSILSNGMGLCTCSSSDSLDGLRLPQITLFIPQPGNTRYYYLFHCSYDSLDNTRPGNLYYSLIDKEGNQGQGAVVQKNKNILRGHILRGGGMTACKHANGRDYWLVMGGSNNNEFYKFLITPDNISGPYSQNIGPKFPLPYDVAYSKFSMDGTKYATCILGNAPILIMDFDRCSGEFSNPDTIFNNESTVPNSPGSGAASVEFSSNNRFLYVASNTNLRQFDLWATDINDSVQLFLADSITWYGIDFLQMAPNGKIYGCTWNGGLEALHVINSPNLKGDSADFIYAGQQTYSIASVNLPNLINYRLGPLAGSGCDTITGIKQPTTNIQQPQILPNPADKYAYVEMGMQGNYEFYLMNVAGQVIATKETKQIDIFDTEHLATGIYFIKVIDKATGNEIAAKKIAVVH